MIGRRASNAKLSASHVRSGMRSVRFWVPDTRTAEFASEAHQQSRNIRLSDHEAADQAFIDSISILHDE